MLRILRLILLEKGLQKSSKENNLLNIHRKILLNKPMLKSAMEYFYKEMIDETKNFTKVGKELELGSGAGFIKKFNNKIITSDLRNPKEFDMKIDAMNMKIENKSLKAIYAINVFHHLPNPVLFFNEAHRVLKKNGCIILIEPHNGFSSRIIHKVIHKDEYFDPYMKEWINTKIKNEIAGANQALSYIVFDRDLEKFKKKYKGKLHIENKRYMNNYLRYLISGGVNFKQLLPTFMSPVLRALEIALKPFDKHLSLHRMIVIKKI